MVEIEMIKTLKVPEGITITAEGHAVIVRTEKGEIKREFKSHRLKLEQNKNSIIIIGNPVNKQTSALLNTVISHIENMVYGLKFGYKYEMKMCYSHFPMTAEVSEKTIFIKNFLGEKHPRQAEIVGETKVEIKGQDIKITGNKIDEVSQTTANITQATKVKKKDIRRFTDGIYMVKKGNIEEIPEDFKFQVIRGRE
ncbi:MAG: 50S ribosomal protein L6 [Candidatus ainarchaeum sp.]|nr:50S ribosomal protein L6 [Candidatus ainarchaeum sp.]